MSNAEVFKKYDMVVAVTQKTINDQLAKLSEAGLIASNLVLTQEQTSSGDFRYHQFPTADRIPRDATGVPTVPCIDAVILPQIEIVESGTQVIFKIVFKSGSACFWSGGAGPHATIQQFDVAGWSYGVSINLGLKAVEQDDIGNGISVPKRVEDQLNHFLDNMFRIDHLFLDFDSVDLMDFDPATTVAQPADSKGLGQLVSFMNFFLIERQRTGNPFILGYSVSSTSTTNAPAEQKAPALLTPVGATFNLYHDPDNPDLSTVNYVLVTAGGHKTIPGHPHLFTNNWINPDEECDAKLIYAHSCLMEPFFLKPLFDTVRSGVWEKISAHISVQEGDEYDAAKQQTNDGISYAIATGWAGDDRYRNNFDVSFSSEPGSLDVNFSGKVEAYKEDSKDMGVCTARAHAQGDTEWSGKLTIGTKPDPNGQATLDISNSFRTDASHHDSGTNTCADTWKFFGNVLGGILDLFTGFADGGFFADLFGSAFSVDIPGIGNLTVASQQLSGSVRNIVILPAGQTFDFSNPTSDSSGNLALQLNYKED